MKFPREKGNVPVISAESINRSERREISFRSEFSLERIAEAWPVLSRGNIQWNIDRQKGQVRAVIARENVDRVQLVLARISMRPTAFAEKPEFPVNPKLGEESRVPTDPSFLPYFLAAPQDACFPSGRNDVSKPEAARHTRKLNENIDRGTFLKFDMTLAS